MHSIDGDQTFRFARTFLQFCGLWLDNNSSRPNLRQKLFSVLGAFSIFIIFVWCLIDIAFSNDDGLHNTISKLLIIIRFFFTLHKLFVIYSNKYIIKTLLDSCFLNFEAPEFLNHQIHIYQNNCYEKMKTLRIIMTLSIFVIFPMWSLIPLMTFLINAESATNILPLKLLLPFDFKVNTVFYAIAYAFQILSLILMTAVVLGFKIFYVTVAVQARRMLRHLCDVLHELHWPVPMTRGKLHVQPEQ